LTMMKIHQAEWVQIMTGCRSTEAYLNIYFTLYYPTKTCPWIEDNCEIQSNSKQAIMQMMTIVTKYIYKSHIIME
jgi:hypothetical protein